MKDKKPVEGQRYQYATASTVIIRISKVPSNTPGYDFDFIREDIPNHEGSHTTFAYLQAYNLLSDSPSFTCKYCYGGG